MVGIDEIEAKYLARRKRRKEPPCVATIRGAQQSLACVAEGINDSPVVIEEDRQVG